MQALKEIKATTWLAFWTLAWVATLALAKFGPRLLWNPQQWGASWAAVAVNFIVGIGWILAFTRFLRVLDELQRKIMQDALAVTLGVGWVVGFAYVVVDAGDLVARDVDVAVLPALMGVVFVIAFAVGKIRYR
ncbi:hypothetical protein F9278_00390 [Streptomyces phaeolivaceus]|uniref:Uncharacterized protein n=1 Tax=Streptomyces phaeolivaceus TaxID=2653200 RepID=A0A5P8JWN4_9ACTN|nr:hypothetical protein [Streptomyces phaeolivaceus]QFQ94912.1 hypothetical protein F9278_00390 [Streptomyces phaeolivaceus]